MPDRTLPPREQLQQAIQAADNALAAAQAAIPRLRHELAEAKALLQPKPEPEQQTLETNGN